MWLRRWASGQLLPGLSIGTGAEKAGRGHVASGECMDLRSVRSLGQKDGVDVVSGSRQRLTEAENSFVAESVQVFCTVSTGDVGERQATRRRDRMPGDFLTNFFITVRKASEREARILDPAALPPRFTPVVDSIPLHSLEFIT